MRKLDEIKIGQTLQKIRKSYGYTQEKLAEKVECSTRYIGDIEQNKSKPSYEILIRICNVFGIGMNEIFSEYLNVKENKETNVALFGFEKLKQANQDTIIHMIEYFNKKA